MLGPEIERMAAAVTASDGKPRFVWTDTRADPATYALVLMKTVAERLRWRAQYDAAKEHAGAVHTGLDIFVLITVSGRRPLLGASMRIAGWQVPRSRWVGASGPIRRGRGCP